MMMSSAASTWFIYILWAVTIIYLIVTAARAKRDTAGHLGQSFLLLAAMIVAFLLPLLPIFSFLDTSGASALQRGLGIVIALTGTVFFVWARQSLGGNWSQTVSVKEDHELVTTGPYRYVRHPMCGAGLVTCLGSALTAGGGFVFLLILLTPLFLWRVGAEDRLLARQFPATFPAYRQRSKALIPFIW